MLSCPLRFLPPREAPVRRGEPVTVGLPWPRGAVMDDRQFRLIGPNGTEEILQTQVLDRWPDGSIRWCLFDFRATVGVGESHYRVEVRDVPRESINELNRPPARIQLTAGIGDDRVSVVLEWDLSRPNGPLRTRFSLRPMTTGPCETSGFLDSFDGTRTVHVSLTIRNRNPADHPGGNWDLGNDGSVELTELNIHLPSDPGLARTSLAPGQPRTPAAGTLGVVQSSSGGPNWQSVSHIDRDRSIPLKVKGFQLTSDGDTTAGYHASPILTVESDDKLLGVTLPHFWENFPKAISANKNGITLHLFPKDAGPHELQGGEQKTHTFYVAFGKDTITDEPLAWCRSPLVCHADPEWYANSGAIPYLTPKSADPNAEYLKLVDQAIEGPDTFFNKREKIDEYGWRHFGDIWGDHEAVYWPGPEPMVSHYNNQYDCVAGFLYQFFRKPDQRWWDLAIPCADHTCDIDVYHTDGDKAAYNRGLFWHTYHYAPADTGTHRSYPKSLRQGPQGSLTEKMDQLGTTAEKLKKAYQVGGGPSASHNYNHGLMLAYFLTGNPIYRDTAVDLAQFVLRVEDPSKTPFRYLSREATGLATESGAGYHGPGRASGNSVNALLVGHQLTGEKKYLDKAEDIIRRVSHPKQNLESLDLLNAELRWFYTMFLQALGRYLDYKIALGQLDEMYAYGRLTLWHYARWMAAHERPILDTPEELQYPTETWAAQEMRKVEVFQFAAKHAEGEEKARFLDKAEWFFRYVEKKMHEFPMKSLCRPVVLMLNFGWSRAWWQRHPDATAPPPAVSVSPDQFGEWRMFVPQKAKAIRRAKLIAAAGAMTGVVGILALAIWIINFLTR
jgi:hypothetical protein